MKEPAAAPDVDQSMVSADFSERNCRDGHNKPERPIYATNAKKSRNREIPIDHAGKVSTSPGSVPVGVSLGGTRGRLTPAPGTSIKCPSPELPEVQRYLDEFRKLQTASQTDFTTEKAAYSLDFAVRMFDKKGGRLQLAAHGVTLDVPPGALGNYSLSEVYVYVQRTSQPSLARDSAFVTPVVLCGRSDLRFNLPVVLTFPVHVKDPSHWELSGVSKDSPTASWKELSGSCNSLVKVENGLCTIIIGHFKGFGVAARPKEPRRASGNAGEAQDMLPLRVGVYRSEEKSGHLQLKVRIWDDSKQTRQHIDREEIHGKLLDTTRKLFLRMPDEGALYRDPGLDLVVVISKLNPLWETEDSQQVIDLARLQPDRSGQVDASCTFNLQLRRYGASSLPYDDGGAGMHLLNCDLDIGQRSHPLVSVTIRALDEIAVQTGSRDSSLQSHRNMHMGEGCPNPMSPEGYGELCRYLEGEKRWKILADHFLGGSGAGADFENWSCPSEALLKLVFSRTSAEGAMITLKHLEGTLRERGLLRAADIVRKEIRQEKSWGKSWWSEFGSRGSLENFEPPYLKAPMQYLDDVRTHHKYDQEDIIYEIPTTMKTWTSTDAVTAPKIRQAEENVEFLNKINTLQLKDLSPHQAEEPSHPSGHRREPTADDWPTGNAESLQSPISNKGDDVALELSNFEQSDQPYSLLTIGSEGNIAEFEQGDFEHYENIKVMLDRVRQPEAKDLHKCTSTISKPIYAGSSKRSPYRRLPLGYAKEVSISPGSAPTEVSPGGTLSCPTSAPRTSIKRPSLELPEVQRYLDEFRKLQRASREDGTTEKAACSMDFAARMLDEKGGRLQLAAHGVTLDVPSGALGDSPEEVFVYVQRTSHPSPAGNSAFVTPVVHCGRSGLQFKLPVVLTFPVHVKDPSQWELSGVRQDSSTTPWEELSGSCDSFVMVKDGLCTIITNHFTGFGVAVRPKEPRGASGSAGKTQGDLPLIVGVYRSEEISGHLELKVRIWDDSEQTRQHIDREEIHGKVLDTTRKLFLRLPGGGGARHSDPGLDLVVVISKLNTLWKTEDSEQVIDSARLQPDRSGQVPVDASCTFKLQLRRSGASSLPYDDGGTETHRLNCDLDICQRSHPELSMTIRALDEIAVLTGSRDSSQQSPLRMRTGEGCPNPMSPEGYDDLCEYLDGEKRWKRLADHFLGGSGAGAVFEKWPSPSRALLNLIFSRTSAEGAMITLENLRDMLDKCGLPGAAKIVQEELRAVSLRRDTA